MHVYSSYFLAGFVRMVVLYHFFDANGLLRMMLRNLSAILKRIVSIICRIGGKIENKIIVTIK